MVARVCYISEMPPKEPGPEKSIEQIVREVGAYPVEAFDFVQRGLQYTVEKMHGATKVQSTKVSRHVTGQDLCEGLRQFALMQWGLLAGTVLKRWNVRRTDDFGRIVFAMVDNRWMQKTEHDNIDDFRDVFDFASAFEEGYRIESKT